VKRALAFNFSERSAYGCLMMRQRSENVLEFKLGNYSLEQLFRIILHVILTYNNFIIINASPRTAI